MLRRTVALAAVAAAVTAGPAAGAGGDLAAPVCTTSCYSAPAGSGPLLVFTGHGWGHGVGMSQYGAYGYAQHGALYTDILGHYYPGTTLGTTAVSRIRVLLADRRKALTISSPVPFAVLDGDGRTHTLAAGAVRFGTTLTLPVDGAATPTALTPPLVFSPAAGSPLTLGRAYRGKILVDVVDGRLRAIDVVGLEQYLDGVVPSEMPSSWAPEALKAQAVAARSYALATRAVGAPFDVYSDTRSQMYLGVSQETAATTAAVTATRRQVLLYAGKVATTFFSSSSGGQTESSQDWTGTALPYLVSVPDPYDAISPYHDWGPVAVSAKAVAKALKLTGTITDAIPTADAAGRVDLLDIVQPTAEVQVSGSKLRGALGLRSTWFDVGLLSLTAPTPAAPVAYGGQVTLSGTIRGVDGVTLEQRPSGGTWQAVAPILPTDGETVTLTEQPTITTDYRLAIPQAAAAFVRIRVTPAVTVTSLAGGQVLGSEQPVLPDAPVTVQQQNPDLTWTTIATGTVNADGTFAVPAPLVPGAVYRAVVTPGHGYAPGAASPQTVAR